MDHYYHPHQHYNPSTIPNLVSKIHFQTLYISSCIEKHKCNHDIELWGRSMFMPQPHQNLYLVPTVTLLGIMLRNRWWPTTFHTVTAGDANGWCLNWLVWSAPHKMLDPKTVRYYLVWHKMNISYEKILTRVVSTLVREKPRSIQCRNKAFGTQSVEPHWSQHPKIV